MKDFLEDFRETVERAAPRLAALSTAQTERRPGPKKWSAKEILGHLIDSAGNNHGRFVRAQLKDDLIFSGYRQDDWVRVQRYQDASWPHLVELWKSYNLHILHVVAAIPEDILTAERRAHNLHEIAAGNVASTEPVALEYLIRDYLAHMKHHLQQIFALADQG